MTSMEDRRAQRFYELRQEGKTLEEISETYLLSVSRVRQIITEYERAYNLPDKHDLRAKELYEMRLSGATTEDVAEKYGLSVSRVSSIIVRYERKHDLPSSAPRMRKAAEKGKIFRDLRMAGSTTEDIANTYLCSANYVSDVITRYEDEYNLPHVSKIGVDKRAEEFRNLRLKGVTLDDIASTHGLTRQRVDQIIKRYEQSITCLVVRRLGRI